MYIQINKKVFFKVIAFGGTIILVICSLIVFLVSNRKDVVSSSNKGELEKEFKDAYEYDIEPNGQVVEIDMVAKESEVEIIDGVKTRVWAYNDKVPGPEVRIGLGDTLKINFTNQLPDETTIHFHGVRVPNAMDGVPGVTQPPIQPGESFVYEFTPKDAGTFWFHPHVRNAEQLERGLFATLIVEDEYSQKYNKDVVWVVDDWRLQDDWQIDPRFVTPMDLMHDGRWGNIITVNASLNQILNVKPGERIRLRFVNASNGRVYSLNFGGLNAVGIAVDGMYVKEVFDADGFELAPGNRLDVDIKIPKDASGKTFYVTDTFTRYTNNLGKIVVDGDVVSTPDFDYPINQNIPDWNNAFDIPFDKEYVLDARRVGMMQIEWTINGKAYPDYDPFTLKFGQFNKFKFTNKSARLHPMHLHGQFFKVISKNGKPYNEGFFRDTVLVGPKETIEIGLVPLDKGNWVQHCHIAEHADAGMMTVVTVD